MGIRIVPAVVLLSGLLLPPATMAQSNSGGGINGIIRDLGNSVNPNQDPRREQNARRYENNDSGRMRFNSEADVRREQQRLDDMRRQLNQEQREFERAREEYEGNR
jgi:hypothetical protein